MQRGPRFQRPCWRMSRNSGNVCGICPADPVKTNQRHSRAQQSTFLQLTSLPLLFVSSPTPSSFPSSLPLPDPIPGSKLNDIDGRVEAKVRRRRAEGWRMGVVQAEDCLTLMKRNMLDRCAVFNKVVASILTDYPVCAPVLSLSLSLSLSLRLFARLSLSLSLSLSVCLLPLFVSACLSVSLPPPPPSFFLSLAPPLLPSLPLSLSLSLSLSGRRSGPEVRWSFQEW